MKCVHIFVALPLSISTMSSQNNEIKINYQNDHLGLLL